MTCSAAMLRIFFRGRQIFPALGAGGVHLPGTLLAGEVPVGALVDGSVAGEGQADDATEHLFQLGDVVVHGVAGELEGGTKWEQAGGQATRCRWRTGQSVKDLFHNFTPGPGSPSVARYCSTLPSDLM
jgi:hypothetical protein